MGENGLAWGPRFVVGIVMGGAVAGVASAGGLPTLTYLAGTEQSVEGSAFVSTFSGFDQDSFSLVEPSATNISSLFSIGVGVVSPADLIIDGSLESSFGATGFSVEVSSVTTIPDPDAFAGTFLDGSVSGDGSATVRFSLAEQAEVEFGLGSNVFASLERVDVPEVIAFVEFGASTSGTVVLEAGEYVMAGGFPFEVDDSSGGFFGITSSSASLSLTVIPGPGVLGVMVAGGVVLSRRRRRAG